MKSGFFLGRQTGKFLDGLRFGLARQARDQLADYSLRLAFGFGKNGRGLFLERLHLGSQCGFDVLTGLRQPREDAERQRRVGEIVGVLDMDVGSPRVEHAHGGEHGVRRTTLGP